jgi:hypothetical protein
VFDVLHRKIGDGNMSKYVAGLIESDLTSCRDETDKFMKDLRNVVDNLQKSRRDFRSSIEILREIRHGKK